MKMLKTKHFRRLVVFLAMIAPAVYLFGVSFAGLQGAHGNTPFDSDTEIVVDNKKVDYVQLLPRSYGSIEYGGVVHTNNYGDYSYVGTPQSSDFLNLGRVDLVNGHKYLCTFNASGTVQSSNSWQMYMNFSWQENYYYLSTYLIVDAPSIGSNYLIFRAALYGGDIDVAFSLNCFDLTTMYPDSPDYASISSDYNVNTALDYSTGRVDYFPVYAVPDGSQYWFSQFFARDNFLVEWGENAISENPRGFAPFGAFWRYLDANILHLSNDQVGLMGYGYIYYACHVLLFDIGFILVTFFLDFIQKIADKFTGGE